MWCGGQDDVDETMTTARRALYLRLRRSRALRTEGTLRVAPDPRCIMPAGGVLRERAKTLGYVDFRVGPKRSHVAQNPSVTGSGCFW